MSDPNLRHGRARGNSVLIVDDDDYVHRALAAALRGLRLHLLTAHNAAEGCALALEHRPDLAIVDVGLPDRNGYQLTAELRRHGLQETRVLILTGHTLDERAARQAGADAFMTKPFRLHQFLDVVNDQLDQPARTDGQASGGLPATALPAGSTSPA